ncbi:MAG: NAD(P)-dependent oxidoreductase [archaeon]|nr:NAD(P)-dependent oxidoreductase [archaeon]
MAASGSGKKVLILGGMGFIGRNLVGYLVKNNLASFIRVADKVLPSTAFLNAEHKAAIENEVVEYKQSNLTSEASIKRAFSDEAASGKFVAGDKFDYVINLAAETKFGQTPEVYNEKVLDLATKVGTAAKAHGVTKFIQVSTAQVYDSGSKPSSEDGKLKPWTTQATYHLKAEEALKGLGLPLVICRPAVVYGPGDVAGIEPRVITGAVYKHLGEKMKFLWTKDLKIHTVHVRDVVKALWVLAEHAAGGTVYNLADKNDTDQGAINTILEEIYGIKTGFMGAAISQMAKLKLKDVCEGVNDKHLKPWSDICKEAGIVNTPLTPYLDVELLSNNSLSIDGSKIESVGGFKYDHPKMTTELIRESMDYFISQGLFPQPKK